jgi:putative membrane protein
VSEPADALPQEGEWRRLSPLSPVVRAGAAVLGLAVILPNLVANGLDPRRPGQRVVAIAVPIAVLALSIVAAVVSWLVTRWRIAQGNLQIETGLIRRQSFRVPLSRIQAIDVVAPLTARLLGLAEVRIVSAGRGEEHARLAYLRTEQANVIRSQLLALAHGLTADTPEPQSYPLLHVPPQRLAAALMLRGATLLPLSALVVLIGIGVAVSSAREGISALLGGVFAGLFVHIVSVVQAFNAEFDFRISEGPDGFRLDRGLLQTRHETIPFGRIQAVRIVEPLLWRPFGWCRLEVDVARQHVSRRADNAAHVVARVLVPVAAREHVMFVLARVIPGATPVPPASAKAPRRARLKAPLSAHLLAAWDDGSNLYARTGRVTASTVILPLSKLQSVHISSGPVQRALRLASLHGVTAGHRWSGRALCRDEHEATEMLWRLIDMARAARRPA